MIPAEVQEAIDCVDQALLDKYPLSGAMWPQWRVLISRIAAHGAEIERLQKDAERWAHARRLFTIDDIEGAQGSFDSFGGITSEAECVRADIAIDAAMRSANGGEVK